ncbi:hypothetical protein [Schumannella soli]|uniref:DUF1795 domain-containing protein n=1 Tax=Schumannella soli TaxID=2590779 RepID=A0A506XQX5_9MICO|nr:hypothetical protein [Schumannella soli]TPW75031.1 hypothetical protein FJ657_12485 [Schumannella soli]
MASALDRTLDIVDYDLGFAEGWLALPLGETAGADGAGARLTAELGVEGPAAESLRSQLDELQRELQSIDDPGMTAVVWAPYPETGTIACSLTFRLAEIGRDDTAEVFAAEMEQDAGAADDGYQFAEVGVWQHDIPAGRMVGARQLILDGDAETGRVVDRVLYGVFVPGARQMVQLIFTAAGVGSFEDIAAETQEIVATLRVRTEEAR